MLDERARAILNLAHQDDLVMLKRREPRQTAAATAHCPSADPILSGVEALGLTEAQRFRAASKPC